MYIPRQLKIVASIRVPGILENRVQGERLQGEDDTYDHLFRKPARPFFAWYSRYMRFLNGRNEDVYAVRLKKAPKATIYGYF